MTDEPAKGKEPSPLETGLKDSQPEARMEKKNVRLYWLGVGLTVLLIALTIAALVSWWQDRGKEPSGVSQPEETTLPAPVKVQLARGEISLEVLNGSGVAGEAKRVAAIFEKLGYKVVKIGNAEDVSGNELYLNSSVKDSVGDLLADAEKELKIASVAGDLTDSTASARLILGKK